MISVLLWFVPSPKGGKPDFISVSSPEGFGIPAWTMYVPDGKVLLSAPNPGAPKSAYSVPGTASFVKGRGWTVSQFPTSNE